MPSLNTAAREAVVRRLVVFATLIGFVVQLAGCSSTHVAHRRPAAGSQVPAETTTSGEVAPTKGERLESKPGPSRWSWRKSKLRRALRREAIATEQGAKEVAMFAWVAAGWALLLALVGALL